MNSLHLVFFVVAAAVFLVFVVIVVDVVAGCLAAMVQSVWEGGIVCSWLLLGNCFNSVNIDYKFSDSHYLKCLY